MTAVEDNVPHHTLETLSNYIIHGWEPGGFVTSMLAMDMERALATADIANRARLWYIGNYIVNFVPEGAWGSYEAVDAWSKNLDDRRTKWNTWNNLKRVHPPESLLNLDF